MLRILKAMWKRWNGYGYGYATQGEIPSWVAKGGRAGGHITWASARK